MPESRVDREAIVRMYNEGAKTADITAATGASRSTIYYVLAEEKVKPSRVGKSVGEMPTADHTALLEWALRRVVELERELAHSERRREAARKVLE